jgi:DNA-binding response OmpR family regulator
MIERTLVSTDIKRWPLLPSAPVLHLGDARILVVDEDTQWIEQASRALSGFDHMRFITDASAALTVAKAWHPELLLLGANLNGTSGLDVCQALRGELLLQDTPIIFVTDLIRHGTEASLFAAGGSDFIPRTASAETLRVRIALHLRLRRLARSHESAQAGRPLDAE